MKFTVTRGHEDIAVCDAYCKSQSLKWRLVMLSVLSFLAGLLVWHSDKLVDFSVPLCIIVPFVCLFSYRESRRKVTLPLYLKPSSEHDHLTGEMSIEIEGGIMRISYEHCEESEVLKKSDIQKVVPKYGYLFIHTKTDIISIPEFPEMNELKRAILYM